MLKLTDPNYHLPVIEALNPFNLFSYGTTAPMAVWGVDTSTGERSRFVVKFKNSGRMSTTSSAFELIGAWMAMELDLPVVEPVLVNVSSDFVETAIKGRDGYRTAMQSQGINFGCKYLEGYTNIPNSAFSLPAHLLETAKLIYVFDMFIANTDRGHQRPNVISNGSKLLIYDHELAFSFLQILPFMRNPTPWILNEADRDLYKNHFFFKMLNELKPDLGREVALLDCFNTDFWVKVYKALPPDWINDQILEIESYLTSIVRNRAYFAESLNKTFAV